MQLQAAVVTDHHVRGSKAVRHADAGRGGILLSFKNHAMVCPVPQIIYRRRPAHIISKTKIQSVEEVMRPVDIHSAVDNMRLCVRDILPAWKIRIVLSS